MRLVLLVAAVAFAGSDLLGQWTSPQVYAQREGTLFSSLFGAFSNGRHVFLDGEVRSRAMTVKAIEFRRDGKHYTDGEGVGRHWSNVELSLGECTWDVKTKSFSFLRSGRPRQVFAGSVTFLTQGGAPRSRPAPWGGRRGSLRFPFQSSYVHKGFRDLCVDFRFSGGKLANSAGWARTQARPFILDGYATGHFAFSSAAFHGQGGTRGCRDSAAGNTVGAYCVPFANTYASTYPDASLRNKSRIWNVSYYTAVGRPVWHVYGFRGSAVGVPIPGLACNRLHVDLAQPHAVLSGRTQGVNARGQTEVGVFPFQRALVGQELWFQAGWLDSVSGVAKLSQAAQLWMPGMPEAYRRRSLYHFDRGSPSGHGPHADFFANPVMRYVR